MAFKKSRAFLKEGARVFVVADSLKEEFTKLPITWIAKTYEPSLLSGMMMVIACVGEESFNARVCADAHKAGIWAMSVTACEQADVHALAQVQEEDYELALGSKGASPYLAKQIVNGFARQLDAKYRSRFARLGRLRKILKQQLDEAKHKRIFILLADFPDTALQAFEQMLETKTIVLFCFHGVKNDASRELTPFLSQMAAIYEAPCAIAYLSEDVAAQSEEVALSTWMEILPALAVSLQLVPMLFQDGRFYRQCQQYESTQVSLAPLFFQDSSRMYTALKKLRKQLQCSAILVIYHSSKSGGFAQVLQKVMAMDETLMAVHEKQQKVILPYRNQRVCVLPLYMLKGMHYTQDVKEESPLCQQLREQGCEVVMEKRSCVELDVFLDMIRKNKKVGA